MPKYRFLESKQKGRNVFSYSRSCGYFRKDDAICDTFLESSIIHPLVPFAGDQILEGRFGNSIRLGNTSKIEAEVTNNWSITGSSGNPITIIRNGQNPEVEPPSWKPITEDINKDLSSVYLTSNQQIPINTGFKDQSYSNPPVIPTEYNQNQIILNSGRLVFNANSDSILVSEYIGGKEASLSILINRHKQRL